MTNHALLLNSIVPNKSGIYDVAEIATLNRHLFYIQDGVDKYMAEGVFTLDDVIYFTNKKTASLFNANKNRIITIPLDIQKLKVSICDFESRFPLYLTPPIFGDIVSVSDYIDGVQSTLNDYTCYRSDLVNLGLLSMNRAACISDQAILRRALKLDVDLMYNTLCDDVLGEIREYLGEDFLESVRQKTISNAYFPRPRKTPLKEMLNKWRVSHLKNYARHMYIVYRSPYVSKTKPQIIKQILSSNISFYYLHRDVACITKTLLANRKKS